MAFALGYWGAEDSYHSKQERYQSYRYASDKPQEVEPSLTGQPNSEALEKREPCRNPKGKDESDLCAQWKAARAAEAGALWTQRGLWISLLGAALTLVSVVLVLRALAHAKEANIISRDTARRQLRAYMSCVKFEITHTTEGATIQLRIENYGETPAFNVVGESRFAIYPAEGPIWVPLEPLNPKFFDTRHSYPPSKSRVIDAKKVIVVGEAYVLEPGIGRIDDQIVKDVLASKVRVVAWGSVEYADIFDDIHRSEAMAEMGAYQTKEGILAYFVPFPDHNGMDRDCRFRPNEKRWKEYFTNRGGEPRKYFDLR